ncbi:hypothetical protein J2Z21_004558 [Streptomyces griseochromogenes]|uniref:Uncharacterized protein n=1 Tax=Streptomyces griseochromogenes TaxID=68214 RepID=A0ABS4LWJ6_9ACTN|nr:hypothetical protein [Streptomyces griseochromogenes]
MDVVDQADSAGPQRWATLRCGVASLTATADRAPFNLHARHVRKDRR